MAKKLLNFDLDDMEMENSTSEENLEIICPTSSCKTIKMLLVDIADGKKEMNEKLSYIKELEEKQKKLEIKLSLFCEREQLHKEKIKDKDEVIAALKASIEIYQSIELYDAKPNKALNEEERKMLKNQRVYIGELQTSLLDAKSQLSTKDVQITEQEIALKQKTGVIAKLKADWNRFRQRTDSELKANKSKIDLLQQLKDEQLLSVNAEIRKANGKIFELEELLNKALEQPNATTTGDASKKQSKELNANLVKNTTKISNSVQNLEKILATKNALLKDRNNQIQQLKSINNNLHVRITKLNNQLTNANALSDSRKIEIDKLKKLLKNAGKNKNEYSEPSLSFQVLEIAGIKPFVATYDSDHEDSLVPSWMIIQRRIDGAVSFDRSWTSYCKGFGQNKSEFWLGLEKLHALTLNKRHELYIYLVDFYNQVRYARYDDFSIASDEENYKLKSLGNYTGNSGDIMRKNEGKAFSTHDSCGGWWNSKNYEAHLNGNYFIEKSMEHEQGLGFGNWYFGSNIPIKHVRMLIQSHEPKGKQNV
ncbi:angiopoietin-related protein 7 isoform X2 [Drosophila tropicalis]